jgi:hypothetical protein
MNQTPWRFAALAPVGAVSLFVVESARLRQLRQARLCRRSDTVCEPHERGRPNRIIDNLRFNEMAIRAIKAALFADARSLDSGQHHAALAPGTVRELNIAGLPYERRNHVPCTP